MAGSWMWMGLIGVKMMDFASLASAMEILGVECPETD